MADRATIKLDFETGDIPDQPEYDRWIDSYPNYDDDFGVFGQIRNVSVAINSAAILALNTTPVLLLAAPPAGQAFVPITVIYQHLFGTTPYATDPTPALQYQSGTIPLNVSSGAVLATGVNAQNIGFTPSSQPPGEQVPGADPLEVTTLFADPTAGDGSMVVVILYLHLGI